MASAFAKMSATRAAGHVLYVYVLLAGFGRFQRVLEGAQAQVHVECTQDQVAETECRDQMLCLGLVVGRRKTETFCVDRRSYDIFMSADNGVRRAENTDFVTATSPSASSTDNDNARPSADDTGLSEGATADLSTRDPRSSSSGGSQGAIHFGRIHQSLVQPMLRLSDSDVILTKYTNQRRMNSPPGPYIVRDVQSPRTSQHDAGPQLHEVTEACVACRRHDVTQLSFKQEVLTPQRICDSDFVFRVRAVSGRGNRYSVQILAVYRLKKLAVLAAPNITDIYIENSLHGDLNVISRPCNCHLIRPGREYLVLGMDDFTAKQLTVTTHDLVLEWSNRVGRRTLRLAPLCFP